jgi:hypothetical protein
VAVGVETCEERGKEQRVGESWVPSAAGGPRRELARLRAPALRYPLSVDDAACLADLRATFAHVYQREIGDRPTGVLGVGCKVP